jgi:FkbM family methyltransferase
MRHCIPLKELTLSLFKKLIWSLKLDFIFLFKIPGLGLWDRLRFIWLKYYYFTICSFFKSDRPRSVVLFGRKFFFPDAYGIASLQRVYCSSYRLRTILSREPVIVDVGANIGQFSFFCHHYLQAQRIISIEPLSGCYALLRLNAPRPEDCFRYAVSTERTELVMHIPHESTQLSTTIADKTTAYKETERVPACFLDEVPGMHAIGHVDLLKIDTEGSEFDVLKAASSILSRTTFVLIEMSIFRSSCGDLFSSGSFLQSRGFFVASLGPICGDQPQDVDGLFKRS